MSCTFCPSFLPWRAAARDLCGSADFLLLQTAPVSSLLLFHQHQTQSSRDGGLQLYGGSRAGGILFQKYGLPCKSDINHNFVCHFYCQSILIGVIGFWGGVFAMGILYLLAVFAKRVFKPEEAEKAAEWKCLDNLCKCSIYIIIVCEEYWNSSQSTFYLHLFHTLFWILSKVYFRLLHVPDFFFCKKWIDSELWLWSWAVFLFTIGINDGD